MSRSGRWRSSDWTFSIASRTSAPWMILKNGSSEVKNFRRIRKSSQEISSKRERGSGGGDTIDINLKMKKNDDNIEKNEKEELSMLHLPSKNCVQTIKMRAFCISEVKLRCVCVGTTVRHGKNSSFVVLQIFVDFIRKLRKMEIHQNMKQRNELLLAHLFLPNTFSSISSSCWISSLDDETFDISMEFGAIIITATKTDSDQFRNRLEK
jgi:hypothetical protein